MSLFGPDGFSPIPMWLKAKRNSYDNEATKHYAARKSNEQHKNVRMRQKSVAIVDVLAVPQESTWFGDSSAKWYL